MIQSAADHQRRDVLYLCALETLARQAGSTSWQSQKEKGLVQTQTRPMPFSSLPKDEPLLKKKILKKRRRRRKLKPGVQKGNLERDESSLSLTSLDPDDFPWAFFLCLPTSAQLACGIPPLSSSGAETSTQNGKTVWEARSRGWLETDAGLVSGRAASGPR